VAGIIRRNSFISAVILYGCAAAATLARADNAASSIGELKQLNVEDLINVEVTSGHFSHTEISLCDGFHNPQIR
jgi:hypothetical protein